MKKVAKSLSCVLLALVLTLSVAVLPATTVQADEAFTHPLSETANSKDQKAMEELKELGAAHIISFDVNDFKLPYAATFGDAIIDDDGAYNGKAARLYAESRQSEKTNYLNLANSADCLPLNLVNMGNSVSGMQVIGVPSMTADGNYHIYKMENTIAHKGDSYRFLYIFNDWGFQVPTWGTKLEALANKTVNIYLSMKIEGDLTFTNTNDLPVYYIDRIIVTDSCRAYDIEYTDAVEATCTENAGTSGICPKCGNTVIKYEMGTRLDHSYTNYVMQDDGSQIAECDYGCGATDTIDATEPTEEAPEETTAPADNEETPDETKAPADNEETPDETKAPADDKEDDGSKGGLSPVILIVFGVVIVALIAAAVVVLVKPNKKETAADNETKE